jgi:hypothetical protein
MCDFTTRFDYLKRQGRIQTDATDASASVKIFARARIVNILLKHI